MAVLTLAPVKDARVYSASTGTNYGDSASLYVGESSGGSIYESFVGFDLSGIPLGSRINSAVLYLHQFDSTEDWLVVTVTWEAYVPNADWTEMGITWSNRPTAKHAASPAGATCTFNNSIGTPLDFNVAGHVQQIAYGNCPNYGFKIRYTGTTASTNKAVRSKEYATASMHPSLVVNYDAPTAPSTPTSPSMTPNPFFGSLRCQWGASSAGINNAVTSYYLRLYANGVQQWAGNVGNVLYKDFDVSGWGEGVQASFSVYAIATYAPSTSATASASGVYKNTRPNAPTNASVPQTSYIPSDIIRVSFTNNGDPNNNCAGFEVAMQNAASAWYNGTQIMGTNASGSATYVDINTTGWSQGAQWKFFVRGYDTFGVRGNWSNATALLTMNEAPLAPTIGYPVAGSTVYNRTPRILLTAAPINDGTKHIAEVQGARLAWLSSAVYGALFSCGVNDNLATNRKLVFKSDVVTDTVVGSNTMKMRMYDSFLYSTEVSRQFNMAVLAFTDANLAVANMKVRSVHITQLQTAIGTLRAAYGLSAVAWKAVTPNVTKIGDATIITQMQTAVQDIINQINGWDSASVGFDISVTWVTVTVAGGVSGTLLRQAIEQLRSLLSTI